MRNLAISLGEVQFLENKKSTSRLCASIFLLLLLLVAHMAEGANKQELADFMRAELSAWNAHDVDAIARAFAKYDAKPVGFGFRTFAWRDIAAQTEDAYRKAGTQFFDQMEYYETEFEELHTSVEGDIGLAWGVRIEKYKVKGQAPEKARIRFSGTYKKEPDGWRRLLFHRDIQSFDEQGQYLREHTKVSKKN